MAEGSMAQIMAHTYGPSQLCIQTQGTTYRGGNGSHMKNMLHSSAYMIVGRSIENLSLVLQSSKGRRMDDCCSITIIGTSDILFPGSLTFHHFIFIHLIS